MLAIRTLLRTATSRPLPLLSISLARRAMTEKTTTRAPPSPISDAPAAKKARLDDAAPPTANATRQGDAAPPQGKAKLSKRQAKKKKNLPEPCSAEDVLWHEIREILGAEYVDTAMKEDTDFDSPFTDRQQVELEVVAMSSSGNALATSSSASRPWVVAVPFCVPGETVRVRIYRNERMHSVADLLEVITPNPAIRDDSLVQCKYFGTCGGCQYQMLSYEKQLDLKRDVVVKAYANFSDLPSSSMPPIEFTMPSPLQYNYRTKITPHFNAPTKTQRSNPDNPKIDTEKPSWFQIGFNRVGTHKVIDIEDCPIATPVIREAIPAVRANAVANLYTYKKGVSLILRDSLPLSTTAADIAEKGEPKHVCVTNHRGRVRERVGTNLFEYPASSFFQNNNVVMPSLVSYVRERIFESLPSDALPPTHLVDAYCGAGLFAISLASSFKVVTGIELSVESIQAASLNAKLNSLPPLPAPSESSSENVNKQIIFRAGDATSIFATVKTFPTAQTVVIIDPPRKGCDEPFIEQLVGFGAQTVVYVSCNVHTQARDVGMIMRRDVTGKDGKGKGRYVLESVRGFDLFPQTAHVESVAVLRLVEGDAEGMDVDVAVEAEAQV